MARVWSGIYLLDGVEYIFHSKKDLSAAKNYDVEVSETQEMHNKKSRILASNDFFPVKLHEEHLCWAFFLHQPILGSLRIKMQNTYLSYNKDLVDEDSFYRNNLMSRLL